MHDVLSFAFQSKLTAHRGSEGSDVKEKEKEGFILQKATSTITITKKSGVTCDVHFGGGVATGFPTTLFLESNTARCRNPISGQHSAVGSKPTRTRLGRCSGASEAVRSTGAEARRDQHRWLSIVLARRRPCGSRSRRPSHPNHPFDRAARVSRLLHRNLFVQEPV